MLHASTSSTDVYWRILNTNWQAHLEQCHRNPDTLKEPGAMLNQSSDLMMIMQVERQDFNAFTGHMYLKLTFIGLTFLCQKTSQNKQIPVCPADREHYVTSRSRLRQRQRLGLAKIKIQDTEKVHVSQNTLNTLG